MSEKRELLNSLSGPTDKIIKGFKQKTDELLKNLPKFQPRGRNAYNEVINNTPKAPYVKNEGTNKKFPYLSSKHHTGNISNPMQTDIRNKNAMTVAEEKKLAQDNMINGDFVGPSQGTRGSTFFGDKFNRGSERNARIAVERHNYLTDAASKGELALKNALNPNRMVENKNGVMINAGRLVDELYPMNNTMAATNLDGSYASNPSGQSLQNIKSFQDLADKATGAQDLRDYISSGRLTFKQKLANMKSFTVGDTDLDLDTPSFDVRTGY